ncbi:type I restriction endonuclease subunit R [Williamsoniiplasma lucivorax]|uniref:Type I restriction enzyme endonuclease subunit n=1 Tax=Williamsoniiplasma lucivorax TaxID=209274 RepID=A0A2S5RFV1_9MOLU|nr:HsdR family type I site-specific deoxyribonuclease [Williamsoniiplasma lucivorax]PPE06092.1 type I restriction enzyme, R subunit [Williamsoniiplasma lucivorax]
MAKTNFITEFNFEEDIELELKKLGWESISDFNRKDNQEVFNYKLLTEKIQEINRVNEKIAMQAIQEIKKISDDLISMNIQGHSMLVNGIKIFDQEQDRTLTIKLISENTNENTYQLIRQFNVSNGTDQRLPDIVLFVNGLPIVIMELKSPLANEKIEDAFKQNESLKRHCPKLWTFNMMNFLSNAIMTKYGSITSSYKYFYGWNKENNNNNNNNNANPIEFLFKKEKIYQIINLYSFYTNEQNPVKYLAAPHQIKAVQKTIDKLKKTNDNRGGVVWHTQGSGKSVTMLFLAKAITREFNQPTILMITDRNDLDKQLFQRFLNAESFLRNKAEAITSRQHLVNELNDKKHFGIYFSTVQKFVEETGVLSNRDDIFLLVDEAHRTQNNLDGERILSKEKEEWLLKFGYARYMRDAFPNAKITGFTGTPLMKFDKNTKDIFGEYNDIYSMRDAVNDGATVPIYYELRKTKIDLNPEQLEIMDQIQEKYTKTLDFNDLSSEQKIETLLKNVNSSLIFEDPNIIHKKAVDMINHLKKRTNILHGKAMIVANSRKAAYIYYQNIMKEFPEYRDQVILVMTESNNKDKKEMADAIVPKAKINEVAVEFRKPNSKYKIAIVVDMWLTGFDVPDLDVMYLDKIIKWHNLMQAIARVNRVYEDKDTKQIKVSGLIVDYIGIWKFLADALLQYNATDIQDDISIEDVHIAQEKLNEAFQILNENYIPGITKLGSGTLNESFKYIMNAYENILSLSVEEKNKFIKLARKINRFFKIAYSVITEEEAIMAKGVETINSLLTVSVTQKDETLNLTIDSIKQAVADIVDTSKTDIQILESKISKDINKVSEILVEEAENLMKTSPRVSAELLRHSIEAQIMQMEHTRPVFAQKASDKLRDIVNELSKSEKLDNVIEMLKQLAKEVTNKQNEEPEFKDPQLQAFFEVLADDEYLTHNNNSEILQRIAKELMESVKENITEQYHNNESIKHKVKLALIKLLQNNYNYPPKKLEDTSGIFVDEITKQIKINEGYFRKDD